MSKTAHLSNTDFLTHLTDLLTATHNSFHGSVFLTQKPLSPASDSSTEDSSTSSPPSQILIRATNGKSDRKAAAGAGVSKTKKKAGEPKVKFSTVVDIADVEDFFARYADVCKAGMQGLRKRDRKKGKKKAKGGKKEGGK